MANPKIERFWNKIEFIPFHTCWEWVGGRHGKFGYGAIKFDKKIWLAHRFSYSLKNGSIPDGLFICHKCDNPSCVNPDHLYAGTHQDNMRDKKDRKRTNARKHQHHWKAKLSMSSVQEIRAKHKNGGVTQIELSRIYGVSGNQINLIVHGKAWK